MAEGIRGARRRETRRWRLVFVAAVALCLIVFAVNGVYFEVGPGTVWGLAYGTAAALLLVVAALYGVRRRAMRLATRRRLGRARDWLALHLCCGGLFLLLMLMHSGFRLPTGMVTWGLWALGLWTVASGLVGLALQRWIPRALGSGPEVEVVYERIPELVAEIRDAADGVAAACDEPVQALYARRVAPALAAPRRSLRHFFDVTGGKQARLRELNYLRRFLPPAEGERLGRLAQLYESKLEIDVHYTLQQTLRIWLWAHVPVSVVLMALLVIHLATVWYY